MCVIARVVKVQVSVRSVQSVAVNNSEERNGFPTCFKDLQPQSAAGSLRFKVQTLAQPSRRQPRTLPRGASY